MKTLGVIGGLGPMATAYFMQLVTQMTDAETDQKHIRMLVASNPAIPDRTRFILGQSSDNPAGKMAEEGLFLKNSGAQVLAIPCITAHYFHDELESKIGLPIIHAMEETGKYLKDRHIERVGLMATDGTILSCIFQRTLEKYGVEVIVPDAESQQKVMDIIYRQVKAGKPVNMRTFNGVSSHLRSKGAEVVLLGCTELSVVKRDCRLRSGYLDVMEVLAMKAVSECGVLRKEYRELITR